jgi:hypothetical protein
MLTLGQFIVVQEMNTFFGLFRCVWRQGRQNISTSSIIRYYSYEPGFPIAGRHPKITTAHEAVSAIKSSRRFYIIFLDKYYIYISLLLTMQSSHLIYAPCNALNNFCNVN